jgi:nucleoside-diphosphate-sugar epimerase
VNARNLSAITLKLFDTYGPNDPRPKLLQLLHNAAQKSKRLQMSPGEQKLSLVYIDDVVDAFLLAADFLTEGVVTGSQAYTVGADQSIRLRDLVELFGKVAGKPLDVEWGAQPYRSRQMMIPCSRGKRLPGWKQRVALEDGLRRIVLADSQPNSQSYAFAFMVNGVDRFPASTSRDASGAAL